MPQTPLSFFRSPVVCGGGRCATVMAGTRWSSVATAVLLAACVHSPQAAVQTTAEPLVSKTAAAEAPARGCAETPASRSALQGIAQELKAQGLAFRASCQVVQSRSGWVVQVRVVDGMKASQVVRGPLADGHDVDMGTPPGVELAGAQLGAQGFSPDVQHNRDWLRGLMARHQFDNLPTAWWHFAQRGASPASASDTDLAAR
ncbi:M15 family metallopeptidase [Acidovorax sp. sic0104]|uniref:M15 family metallopeptidase n=1 Tax=Acidovorax sp. sic0104 TaxID=2854784 RepID=UPI00210666F4|nr:M15 family metallopeptidase [Acidovorax sp. sic0104]